MADAGNRWRNRITRSNVPVSPDQLLANGDNWRIHPAYQQQFMVGGLEGLGWVRTILVQEGTDLVIDGHMRVALAITHGEATVPVDYVDLTAGEVKLALATIDPIASYARHDKDQLDALYRDVDTGNRNLQALVSAFAEHNGLYLDQASPSTSALLAPQPAPLFEGGEMQEGGMLAPRPPDAPGDPGVIDPAAEWVGMPEFEQEDQMPVKQVIVSFTHADDVAAFARLLEQNVTMTTKSIWYPAVQRGTPSAFAFTAEAGDES